jgi:hypothetical protein
MVGLRLRMTQEYRVVEWLRDRAAQMVREIRDLSVVLHVYGVWDEEETFTLLA